MTINITVHQLMYGISQNIIDNSSPHIQTVDDTIHQFLKGRRLPEVNPSSSVTISGPLPMAARSTRYHANQTSYDAPIFHNISISFVHNLRLKKKVSNKI